MLPDGALLASRQGADLGVAMSFVEAIQAAIVLGLACGLVCALIG